MLDQQFINYQKNDKEAQLPRILGVYVTLGRSAEAEVLYRKSIVSPAMDNLISEDALASNPRGLTGLYDSVINFIDEDMKVLLQLTRHTDQ